MRNDTNLIYITSNNVYLSFEDEIYCYDYVFLEETIKEIFDKLNLEHKTSITIVLHFNCFSNLKEIQHVFKKYNCKGIFSLLECFEKSKKYIIIEDKQSYILEKGKLEKSEFNLSDFEENQDFGEYILIKNNEDILKQVFDKKHKFKKNYFKKIEFKVEYFLFIIFLLLIVFINKIFNIDNIIKEKEKLNLEIIKLNEEDEEEIEEKEILNLEIKKEKLYEQMYFILSLNIEIDFLNIKYENKKWEIEVLVDEKGLEILEKNKKIKINSIIDFEDKIKLNIEV